MRLAATGFRTRRMLGLLLVAVGLLLPTNLVGRTPQAAAAKNDSIAFEPDAFAKELNALRGSLAEKDVTPQQEASIGASLPATWKIHTPDGDYEVPTAPLRRLLECANCDSTHRKERLDEARSWVGALATQAKGYAAPASSGDSAAARPKLDSILARREFAAARPRSQAELLRQRFNRWLLHVVEKLFQGIGKHPMGAKALFWLIVFVLVGWLALVLVRFWMRRARIEELKNVGAIARHRSWQEWIRAGREAAARGDFREAIHCVYWAGVTHLEDGGAIQVDRTRTPREHLRLLTEAEGSPGFSMPKRRDYLAALTSQFERVWYGHDPVGKEDFQTCLRQAEELGCRLL
jgi:Domain of unknown function (DUF4129)